MNLALSTMLDDDQAAAIEAFASAEDGVLTYAELEARGVSRPASVGYELAAAGWPVSRAVVTAADGHRQLGLRMLPGHPLAAEARRSPRAWGLGAVIGVFR